MEAELITCFEASNKGIWLRNFVIWLQIMNEVERPIKTNKDLL